MEKFVITGGKPLHGAVTISGAKNAAVGILPATILAGDVCVIENLPDISDVAVSLKILSVLGARINKKSTILVSLLNAVILLIAVGIIIAESIDKLFHPVSVDGSAIAWCPDTA